MASNMTGIGPLFVQRAYVQQILQEARNSSDPSLSDAGDWALGAITKAASLPAM